MRLAASRDALGVGADGPLLVEAFRALGWEAREEVWDAIEPGPEPVLLRHTWDYHRRLPEFLAWLERHERAGTPFLNPPRVVRWNTDKRYLTELAARGVEVPPTEFLAPGVAPDARALAARLGSEQVVVKPAVAASAFRTRRVDLADAAALASAVSEAADGCHAMVQAFVPEIAEGEWSLVVLGGALSHAVLKTPAPGDFRSQAEHGGTTRLAEPPRAAREAAERALAAVDDELAFARVDGVEVDGRFVLMELELIEPELFLEWRPEAATSFSRSLVSHFYSRQARRMT